MRESNVGGLGSYARLRGTASPPGPHRSSLPDPMGHCRPIPWRAPAPSAPCKWCQFTAGNGCEGPQPSRPPPIIVATTRWAIAGRFPGGRPLRRRRANDANLRPATAVRDRSPPGPSRRMKSLKGAPIHPAPRPTATYERCSSMICCACLRRASYICRNSSSVAKSSRRASARSSSFREGSCDTELSE